MTEPTEVRLLPNQGWDERVLVCASGRLVQTFIVVSQRYVVLVDTMAGPDEARALLAIAAEHLEGRQLLVLNSHADWDHAWGNQVFVGPAASHPAPLLASRRCAERLRGPAEAATLATKQAEEPGRFDAVQLTPPTMAFDNTLQIDGGDLRMELFPTPGHQPDHIAVFIPELELLLAGDAAELPFPLVYEPDALSQLRASLAQMRALPLRHALYCHAPVDAGPSVLDANLAYFNKLEAQCRAALAQHDASALLTDAADLEALTALSFAEALPAAWPLDQATPDEVAFYQRAHRRALRVMVAWLAAQNAEQSL